MVNGKEVRAIVEFENFFFTPYFNRGEHSGVFTMSAWIHEMGGSCVTSPIINIHKIDDTVYVETQNSLYQLDGTKKIRRLDEVIRYLNDENYTTKEFYDYCVPNRRPSRYGWRVF